MDLQELSLPELRAEQQRKVLGRLGECIYRIQQCELLLKRVVAMAGFSAPIEGLNAAIQQNAENVQSKTMGVLIGMLEKGVIDGVTPPAALSEGTGDAGVRISIRLELGQDQRDDMQAGLKSFVEMRNRVVHHFAGQFSLVDAESCEAALVYLDACSQRIDMQIAFFERLSEAIGSSIKAFGTAADTPEFEHLLLTGIHADGSFDWPTSGAVRVLYAAESVLSVDGWTKLNDAAEWGRANHPQVTPELYGCASWRDVIYVSRMFEVRRSFQSERGVVWYRSK